jgi:hypothetical protein
MKTTIEIPDDVFRRAKASAASKGIPLRQLITEAVEQRLRAETRKGEEPAWRKLAGGLSSLRRETARVGRLVEDEFERLDPEDAL